MWNFEIITISESDNESAGEKWFHYEIGNHITRVSGRRRGTREEVTAFVEASVRRLNTRHLAASPYYGR